MVYLDGELPPEEMASVASHLEECVHCQMLAVEFSDASAKLQAWRFETPQIPMSPRLTEALKASQATAESAAQLEFGHALLRLVTLEWIHPVFVRRLSLGFGAVAAIALLVILPRLEYHRYLRAPATEQTSAAESVASLEQPRVMYDRPDRSAVAGTGAAYQPGAASTAFPAPEREPTTKTGRQPSPSQPEAPSRMLVRTGRLALTTKQFDQARDEVNLMLGRYQGYVGVLRVNAAPGTGRVLDATLRIPSDRLDAALADLKKLGHVDSESMSGDEVSQQYVDLVARLTNARKTEQRLNDLILNRTGKISDVLEVERYRSETRGEIERMEAEKKNLENQVQFSTIRVTINEEYKAQLPSAPSSSGNQLWNAAVRGYTRLVNSILDVSTLVLIDGPTLLLWCAVLGLPAYWARKRWLRKKPT